MKGRKRNSSVQQDAITHSRTIYMTSYDKDRLRTLLDRVKDEKKHLRADLSDLEAELARAKMVKPESVPGDVITMNSQVRLLDRDTGEELMYTLVFPEEANIGQGKISIFAPVGTAMLGHRVGDTFEWDVPDGVATFEVKAIVYQPEAAGDYHL